jgi:hypothetical protein
MKQLTTGDMILVAVSACLVAASFFSVGMFAEQGSIVLVQVDGRTVHKSMLAERDSTVVTGAHGRLTVEIRGGKVAITRADCPNHICVKTGWRSGSDEIIVCVPNKTVVRIVAGQEREVRATTG